jgi:zinc transport system substrate-binding protein
MAAPAGADEAVVVASIKPVHSLVAGVMEGVGEPVLLVKGAGSEHSYSLRPSEARALAGAAVVFWVGETLETFLIKPLQTLASDAQVVELSGTPGLILYPTREGGTWEAHEPEDEQAGGDADHGHGETDMHVWLDPRNAKVLVDAIARTLRAADPGNAARYEANAARLRDQLDELDRTLEGRLAAVRDRPYVVFHDAYQYFERRYGTNALGAITINPTQRPGAQRLNEIQARLAQLDAACVFAEPQFEPALVETVVERTDARRGVLDPLGMGYEAGPGQYFLLMEGLADALVECLKP